MLKVGLIGLGKISAKHIAAWEAMEDAQLVALCSQTPEKLQKHPDKHHYSSLDSMLSQENLDILDICLPTFLHTETALKAMNAGVHVLCEKPISLHREDVGLLYEAARKNNVRFMVAQLLRFAPEYMLLKQIFDDQRYGKLLSGSMSRIGPWPANRQNNWMMDGKLSGLVPFDLHIHDLDFMVYAFGAPKGRQVFQSKQPDQHSLCTVYQYDDFFIHAEAAWYAAAYPFTASFRFQFEDAVIVKENGLKIYMRDGCVFEPELSKIGAMMAQIRYFADCVIAEKNPDIITQTQLETVLDILGTF